MGEGEKMLVLLAMAGLYFFGRLYTILTHGGTGPEMFRRSQDVRPRSDM